MSYKDSNWNIVSSKKKTIKEKRKKIEKIVGRKFYYIWKTRDTWTRIVYYEWIILEYDQDSWLVTIKYKDRNIRINPNYEYKVLKNIPLKVLHLD